MQSKVSVWVHFPVMHLFVVWIYKSIYQNSVCFIFCDTFEYFLIYEILNYYKKYEQKGTRMEFLAVWSLLYLIPSLQ